jgi:tetratricopeptide (TPR) repeat protein
LASEPELVKNTRVRSPWTASPGNNSASLAASSEFQEAPGPSELELEMNAQVAAKLLKQRAALREEEKATDDVQRRPVVPQEILENQKGVTVDEDGRSGPAKLSAIRRAKIAYRNGNYSVAVEAYKEALQSNNKAKTRMGYGKALYRDGSDDPAERELRKAERAGAADEEAYRFLIDLLGRRGDDAGANAYKQKLQALSQR